MTKNWNSISSTALIVLSLGLISACGDPEKAPEQHLRTGIIATLPEPKSHRTSDRLLELYDLQGQPLPEYIPALHVNEVQVSKKRVAYLQETNLSIDLQIPPLNFEVPSRNVTFTNLVVAEGSPAPTFTAPTLYSRTNIGRARATHSIQTLHVLNERGAELYSVENVDEVKSSDNALAYHSVSDGAWHFLNNSGYPLHIQGIGDAETHTNDARRAITEVYMSNQYIAFKHEGRLFVRTITGKKLPGWSAITNARGIRLNNTFLSYTKEVDGISRLYVRNLSLPGGHSNIVVLNYPVRDNSAYELTDNLIAVETSPEIPARAATETLPERTAQAENRNIRFFDAMGQELAGFPQLNSLKYVRISNSAIVYSLKSTVTVNSDGSALPAGSEIEHIDTFSFNLNTRQSLHLSRMSTIKSEGENDQPITSPNPSWLLITNDRDLVFTDDLLLGILLAPHTDLSQLEGDSGRNLLRTHLKFNFLNVLTGESLPSLSDIFDNWFARGNDEYEKLKITLSLQ